MENIQLSDLQKNLHNIIEMVSHSYNPIGITNKGKLLVKIVPISTSEQKLWLGCMNETGKITGDIKSPAESPEAWNVLSG